jgi:tRNA threonylcarbamoyladenosine biosynthesis protein TsaB
MTLLAIETTGARAEVSIVAEEAEPDGQPRESSLHPSIRLPRALASETFEHRMDLAQWLMPRVDAVLDRAGIALGSLSGIAVSLGPGSYTGIRIGVVTAKALAYAAGLPLAGVPTLEALAAAAEASAPVPAAAPAGAADRLICAVIPARADEVYAALYQRSDGALITRAAVTVMRLEALTERLGRYPGSVLLAGDAPEMAARLAAALGPRLRAPEGPPGLLAPWVAALGRRRLAGGGDDPATLAPLYVRAPTISLPDGRVVEVP